MKSYYQGRHARNYNRQWHTFTERTLTAVLPALEKAVLSRPQNHQLRILDVGCGTGILLKQLAQRFPAAELYGVDASPSMLEQARHALRDVPHIHLTEMKVGSGAQVNLPFAPTTFDLITCSNTLHYFTDPVTTLRGWRERLVSLGHIVMEDYILRSVPLPWHAFEWVIKFYDPQHVRLYRPSDVQAFSQQAGFQVLHAHTFPIDFFCQGWVVLLTREGSGASLNVSLSYPVQKRVPHTTWFIAPVSVRNRPLASKSQNSLRPQSSLIAS